MKDEDINVVFPMVVGILAGGGGERVPETAPRPLLSRCLLWPSKCLQAFSKSGLEQG